MEEPMKGAQFLTDGCGNPNCRCAPPRIIAASVR